MSKARKRIGIIPLEPKAPKIADELAAGFNCKDPTCPCQTSGAPLTDEQVELLKAEAKIRTFPSGATRDTEEGKLDIEAYLNPAVLAAYCRYMRRHQICSDGTKRAGDDWQKGMSDDVYAKSLKRHDLDVWLMHRGYAPVSADANMRDSLCGIIFNAMGMLLNNIEGDW